MTPNEPTLFDEPEPSGRPPTAARRSPRPRPGRGDATTPAGRVVRVLPDQTGITKTFDYVVPERWDDRVKVGTRIRVALGPRRVGAWVVETDVSPATTADLEPISLKPISKVSGHGPSAELIDLAGWAAWRWAARTAVPFLRTASPDRVVAGLPDPPPVSATAAARSGGGSSERRAAADPVIAEAFTGGACVLRLPPTAPLVPVLEHAATLGDALVICPSRAQARRLASRMRQAGVPVAVHPEDWAAAAAGGSMVIGTRASAWAPSPNLASVVVIDEHDEVHQEEGSPTWNARDTALERARRLGVPCVLTSPMPTLEALSVARLVRPDRGRERAGWPAVIIADRREDDAARNALFSPVLAEAVRSDARIVCVLNQKGRAALLACAGCAGVARCDDCGAAVHKPGDDALVCRRCGAARPVICAGCGTVKLRTIRLGVGRVRDDLEAMAGERVIAVTGDTPRRAFDDARLFVGTEAVLHQVQHADVVAFLDLDQELLAARYRAAEQALALIVRAGRLVGGRGTGGRVLLQTRVPDHEVCRAALVGDPERVSDAERERRSLFGLPPFRAVAEIGGQAGAAFVDRLRSTGSGAAGADAPATVEVVGPVDGTWRVTAATHGELCDALHAVERPPGRLRLAVDPLRS